MRVIRTCREMGIKTVAVHSEADREALHVRYADEAVCIGPPSASESYLSVPAVIAAAETTGCEAVHPGYGFLSEDATFAEACQAHDLTPTGGAGARGDVQAVTRCVAGLLGDHPKAMRAAARSELPVDALCPHRFRAPLAPGVAARRLGQEPDWDTTLAAWERLRHGPVGHPASDEGEDVRRLPAHHDEAAPDMVRQLQIVERPDAVRGLKHHLKGLRAVNVSFDSGLLCGFHKF